MTKTRKLKENGVARYEKIAVDVAYSISKGEWAEGDTIKGRSTLSGKYGVSSETIRRGISLLEEAGVVSVQERKGIVVLSAKKAKKFIEDSRQKDKILVLREEIAALELERAKVDQVISKKVDSIIEQALVLRNMGIISPLETRIRRGSPLIGQTIGEVQFWKHTGATIIGIHRNTHLLLSPGPAMIFYEDDIVLYVGNGADNIARVELFVNPKADS